MIATTMAVVIASSMAFFILAMPAGVFGQIVNATGLPSILPSAAPPLGATARMLAAVVAGLGSGSAVGGLFLLAEGHARTARPHARRPVHAAEELGLPPEMALDVPAPEFGTSLSALDELSPGAAEAGLEMPSFKYSATGRVAEPDVPGPDLSFRVVRGGEDVAPEEAPDGEPVFIDFRRIQERAGEDAEFEPLAESDALDLGQWPCPDDVVDAEIEFTEFDLVEPAPEPEPLPVTFLDPIAVPKLEPEPEPQVEEARAPAMPEAEAVEAPVPEPAAVRPAYRPDESVADLMQRLEARLGNRATRRPPPPRDRDGEGSPIQSTLEELRKLANAR